MLDPSSYKATAKEATRVFREYMVTESIQQYRDYYESDSEEQVFFQYLDNLPNRDQIRFAELFKDYTVSQNDNKDYLMIQKREYNPELSLFSNLSLDLVDFKDRVRPLARDIALMDISRVYQKQNINKLLEEQQQFVQTITKIEKDLEREKIEEGYSSREIEEGDSVNKR